MVHQFQIFIPFAASPDKVFATVGAIDLSRRRFHATAAGTRLVIAFVSKSPTNATRIKIWLGRRPRGYLPSGSAPIKGVFFPQS